jgi:elongation factor Ts
MSLELVKEVRQITGAGISDVNRALAEAKGDKNKAIEILRKQGQKIATKKSAREIKEGVISLAREADKVAIVALGCETDFVALNQDFVQAVAGLAKKLLELGQAKFMTWAEDYIKKELVVKIGENLQLVKTDLVEGKIIGTYVHSNKKVAAIVVLSAGSEELAKEIAMQVAASAPKYLRPEDVPAEELAKEKEIYTAQLQAEGKPANILEKIMQGKVDKYYTEVCLLNQLFIKDDKKTIAKLLAANKATIEKFSYYSL